MFVADLPPELPPAFIQSVCSSESSSKPFDSFDGMTYSQLLERVTIKAKGKKKIKETMKSDMVKQSGFTYGTQGGFYSRSSEIKKMLKKYENNLDMTFNFSALMMNAGKVIPPVISESSSSFSLTDKKSLRLTDMTYNIDRSARFSSVAPNWRNYLFIMTPNKPAVPDKTLLPVGNAEQKSWENSVKLGWSAGRCQANKSYSSALSDLRHDYIGMVRYHILLRKNMVSMPFVTATNEKITRTDGKLVIGDQTLRITSMPGFKIENKNWDGLVEHDAFFETFPVNPNNVAPPVISPSKDSYRKNKSYNKKTVKRTVIANKKDTHSPVSKRHIKTPMIVFDATKKETAPMSADSHKALKMKIITKDTMMIVY